ncbi:MAG TPA: CoA transferase [Candidatus Microbacterium stercoravium]|uniref:CoA transferase n=1 Tax=Candidatus Microbacterium stercoravium TaxID=2838697 RepID=A0A9D2KGV2_9MICO|nr:CoA transferase [Candidatus Microbacterium stercoravium]
MSVTVRRWWRCPLDVESLAVSAVEAAADEAARLSEERGRARRVETTAELVRAAFGALSHLRVGGRSASVWAPQSGFVRTRDGFVRTHANYPHHAEAIRQATGAGDRPTLDDVASSWRADDLVAAITEAGGVAAVVRTEDEWLQHPHHLETVGEAWLDVARTGSRALPPTAGLPLDGVRVLDLTRVLAGPSCSQLLACLGADVLRVDGPRRPELIDQHLATGMGKRSAIADLNERSADVRALARDADVVIIGYRPGSLDRFGLSPDELAAEDPTLVVGSLSAWGETGPWGDRPGFDSIVQAATGISMLCADADAVPGALPAQALDCATGAHLASRVMGLLADGSGGIIRASLLGAARTLLERERVPHGSEDPLGVPIANVSSPHGELLAVPPPLLVDRATIERDVGGYGASALAWAR